LRTTMTVRDALLRESSCRRLLATNTLA